MFLFAQKHKTPIGTYADSYCLPCSVKKTIEEQAPLQLWKENKFAMHGLTMPSVQNLVSQGQPEQLIKAAMQEYYRNAINPAGWSGPKVALRSQPCVCVSPASHRILNKDSGSSTSDMPSGPVALHFGERGNSQDAPAVSRIPGTTGHPRLSLLCCREVQHIFVNKDKYITWRMGPYNSTAWNKHSSYLPLLPKETRMETFLHSIPMPCHHVLTCLHKSIQEVAADMLHRLSRLLPLSLQPVYTVMGWGPFQGYYSPCSGCHYSLGMDYYIDGAPTTRRHRHKLAERAVRSILCCSYSPRAMVCSSMHHPKLSSLYTSPRTNRERWVPHRCPYARASVRCFSRSSPLRNSQICLDLHGSAKEGFRKMTVQGWDTSHFKKTGGVQRGSYTIHPKFASEAYSEGVIGFH
ncbi:LOW QUALITY PROTEIN: sperm microtubule inner protein 6 [Ciconia maguari]